MIKYLIMFKKIISFIFCIVLVASLASPVFAWEADPGDYIGADLSLDEAIGIAEGVLERDRGKDLYQIAQENGAVIWHYNPYGEGGVPDPVITVGEEDDFDACVDKLFTKYNVYKELENEYYSHITLGYLNLVTGEEHYYNPDKGLVSASLFKVPENMIMCDRIAQGELDFDTQINGEPYKFHQYRTLSRSDNDRAMALHGYLGGYIAFKKLQRPFIGEEPYAEGEYIDGGEIQYMPKNVIYALKTVYSDPVKYNGIIQNMLQAQPYEYFKMFERDYVVAQKYGFINQDEMTGSHTYINCCAIMYTDEPVAIVCMTDNISKAYDVIGEYACVMAQYTQIQSAKHEASAIQSAEEETEERISNDKSDAVPESPEPTSQTAAEAAEQTTDIKERKMTPLSCAVIGLIIIVMLYFLVIVFRRNGAKKVNGVWAVLAIVLASLALMLCVVATQVGTLYARPSGNPGDTVSTFFNCLKSGDYETAYACLEDYSDLGLGKEASSEEGRMMQQALRASYDFAPRGEASVDKLTGKQTVAVRYLDLNAVEADAMGRVEGILKEIVDLRPRTELYDSNNQFRQEIMDEVYNKALRQSLQNAEQFYTTKEIVIDLSYKGGKWLMATSDELLNCLMGGVGA